MEQNLDKKQELIKNNVFNTIEWQENITTLDLSNRNISEFHEDIKLPQNLIVLNLSNNKFIEIPKNVMILENLKTLDISFNNLILFDETPNFCHTVECLKLNNNKLEGPPFWVWSEKPKKLATLDISNNENICKSLDINYLEELLHCTTLVNRIDLHCCRISKDIKLMSTFRHAKIIILGSLEYNYYSVNHIEHVPCIGLEDCCNIEIYTIIICMRVGQIFQIWNSMILHKIMVKNLLMMNI